MKTERNVMLIFIYYVESASSKKILDPGVFFELVFLAILLNWVLTLSPTSMLMRGSIEEVLPSPIR